MEGRRSVALSSPPPALCLLCLASVTTLIKCQAQAGAICCEHASGSPEEKLLKLLPGIGSGGPLGKTGRDSMEKGNKKGPKPQRERSRKAQEEAGDLAQGEELGTSCLCNRSGAHPRLGPPLSHLSAPRKPDLGGTLSWLHTSLGLGS